MPWGKPQYLFSHNGEDVVEAAKSKDGTSSSSSSEEGKPKSPPKKRPLEMVTRKSKDFMSKVSMDRSRPSMNLENQHYQADRIPRKLWWLLAFNSLGVIYGDIGTSPLYVLQTIFIEQPNNDQILGGVSLIIYSLLFLVTMKYVIFVLKADNHGEGGTFALLGLLRGKEETLDTEVVTEKKEDDDVSEGHTVKSLWKKAVPFICIVASSFVIGDGALTPAVSVLSAIEGLLVFNPDLAPWIVPITIIILVALFLSQRFGTAKIGISFAPIMSLWFFSIGALGIYQISMAPAIFEALAPWKAAQMLENNASANFEVLGGVFLAVTGLEALYADLGHFGAGPVRMGWMGMVFPCLVLNYLGQGALLLRDPTLYTNPFFFSVPTALYWPMFVLATLATIIASQALITGCSSLISQAINLGLCPPLHVIHTSEIVFGQIFVPEIVYLVMFMTVGVVGGFGTSSTITSAYGVTVSTVSLGTTILFSVVMRSVWKMPYWKVIPFFLFFGTIDGAFFLANLVKIPTGGWVSIMFGLFFSSIMICWTVGEGKIKQYLKGQGSVSIAELKHHMASEGTAAVATLPYVGVFVSDFKQRTPQALINISRCIHALPKTIIILNVEICDQPHIGKDRWIKRSIDYGSGVYRLTARFGYSDGIVEASELLKDAKRLKLVPDFRKREVSYFLNHEHVYVATPTLLKKIPLAIYSVFKKQFNDSRKNLRLPENSIIEVGVHVLLL